MSIKVVVKYKNTVIKTDVDSLTILGAEIESSLSSINAVIVSTTPDKLGKLKSLPGVEYVEIVDQTAHILGFEGVKLTKDRIDDLAASQVIPWGIEKIRSNELWSNNKGTGIKVCIIDTGIDYTHPDLKDAYKGGYNFINNTSDPRDDHGHGTHVAGTIGARDNDVGVIGVAPECEIYSCKVLDSGGSGSYDAIINAINWAIEHKMQIISMSLGGGSYLKSFEDVCNAAYNAGILVIAAAGNAGGDGSQDTIGYPAKFASVIAVGSTDINDNRSSFSSVGPELEVSAPGSNVLSTLPPGTCALCSNTGYGNLNGTSMSTPHVSGAAALLLFAKPGISAPDARALLSSGAVDLGNPGRDIFFGNGRIDIVKSTSGETPPPPPPPPGKKYSCYANGNCVEDPNGEFNSIEECRANCHSSDIRWTCRDIGVAKFCVPDQKGEFATREECVASCRKTTKKYNIGHITDSNGNIKGISVILDDKGLYSSAIACQIVCQQLKSIDER